MQSPVATHSKINPTLHVARLPTEALLGLSEGWRFKVCAPEDRFVHRVFGIIRPSTYRYEAGHAYPARVHYHTAFMVISLGAGFYADRGFCRTCAA